MLNKLIEIISEFVFGAIDVLGMLGVFILMALESANIPIPSEIIMPFSGFLVSTGVFVFWPVVLIGAVGNLVGSIVSYYLAAKISPKLKNRKEFQIANRWFDKFGIWSVFIARLLPIVRTFISFPAGMFKINIWKFSILTFLGSLVWSYILTYIGVKLGNNWEVIEPYFRKFDFFIVGLMAAGVIWIVLYHFKKR